MFDSTAKLQFKRLEQKIINYEF